MKSNLNHSLPLKRKLQTGLSLIELMVAIAIGLILMLGFMVAFVNMKGAFTSQDQLAQLQDNERLALTVLTATVQSAGYFPDPVGGEKAKLLDLPIIDLTTKGYGSLAAGQGLVGTTGTPSAGETLTTRYVSESGDGLMDCLGRSNPPQVPKVKVRMTNVFSISANNELMCSVDWDGTGFTDPAPLVSNVVGLSVVYGTASGANFRYFPASDVPKWTDVSTARITVQFRNPFASGSIDWVQTVNLMNKT